MQRKCWKGCLQNNVSLRATKPLMQRLWMGKKSCYSVTACHKALNQPDISSFLMISPLIKPILMPPSRSQAEAVRVEPCSQMLERGTGKSSAFSTWVIHLKHLESKVNFHISDVQILLPKPLRKWSKSFAVSLLSHGLSLEAWNLCCPPCPKAGLWPRDWCRGLTKADWKACRK